MEHIEEHRSTILRRREMHSTEKTSTRYAKINHNGSLASNPTDKDRSPEELLEERGIRIVESNLKNFSNISPIETADYYKGLGDWQDVLPKTDYSYSPVSIYNKKKINGIYPVIPNMSRRNLWKNNFEITEIKDNQINSIYDQRYSILNKKRWYTRNESPKRVYHAPSYFRTMNLRQWISNKRSSISQSTEWYQRWRSYFKRMRTQISWSKSSISKTSSSSSLLRSSLWMKILTQYVFPFLILFSVIYFFLWSPFWSSPSLATVNEIIYTIYSSVYCVIESLFSLVYNFINFTLASGTFIFSSFSWPRDFSLKTIPNLIFVPLYEEFRTFIPSKEETTYESSNNEKIRFDSTQLEEVFRRLFDSNSEEFVRKIVNSEEFVSFINEKMKNVEKQNKHTYETLIRENSNFEERFKSLELLIVKSESNTSEQIKQLQTQVLTLREEIKLKETKIENDFFILLSTVLQVKPDEEIKLDDLKAKFVSLFRSIEEAHFRIDKLNREFSTYMNNASDEIKIVVQHSNERLKFDLKSFVEELMSKKLEEWKTVFRSSSKYDANTNAKVSQINDIEMLEKYVKKIVQKAIDVYDADKTGMTDYALESSGGIVLSTRCTETKKSSAQFSILGIPFWKTSRSPRTVIQPSVYPGECWAFPGSTGYLVIQLSENIFVTGVSLEHIPKAIALNGTIDSAPKDFSVWALRSENDQEAKLLGKFQYNDDGPSVQYFEVIPLDQPYQIIELKILSNHGKIDYTCLYRFRVHGIPA